MNWRDRAACQGLPTALFFPTKGHNPTAAKRICAACPVRQPCLDYALATRDIHLTGVWGATTENERTEMARTRHAETPTG